MLEFKLPPDRVSPGRTPEGRTTKLDELRPGVQGGLALPPPPFGSRQPRNCHEVSGDRTRLSPRQTLGTQPEFSPSAPHTGRPTQAEAPAPSSVHRALLTSKPTGAQEQKPLHISIFVIVSKSLRGR
jgi:hypothetical protein